MGKNVPFLRIDEVRGQSGRVKYFLCINFRSEYHKIRFRNEYIPKTAFRTVYGQQDLFYAIR